MINSGAIFPEYCIDNYGMGIQGAENPAAGRVCDVPADGIVNQNGIRVHTTDTAAPFSGVSDNQVIIECSGRFQEQDSPAE
jgi:hypothetical protein